ncbi:hypothetical protein D3C79_766310 [compost metagenome]
MISIRVTLMPQGAVAASMVRSSFSLMVSRWESISSSSMAPSTVRMLVMVRLRMALVRSLTS